MEVQVTIVVKYGDGRIKLDSNTLAISPTTRDPIRVIGDEAAIIAKGLIGGRPTPVKEGGRG